MAMISIKTRLDKGIYRSCGGGETITHYQWPKTSARNLLLALRRLPDHRAYMIECYGNIGCGYSWIDVDGVQLDRWEFAENTAEAAQLLDEIQSGTYLQALALADQQE